MTRLETLCKAHDQQGGTIFQFERMYGIDFISMSDLGFEVFMKGLNSYDNDNLESKEDKSMEE